MYWQTTLIVLIVMCLLFATAGFLNHRFRGITTLNLALVAALVAFSIVLTNFVGYSRILFGKQVELGNFVLLFTGMLFGPWAGISAAIVADLLGAVLFLGGTFHIGFMVVKMLFGVFGALIFTNFLVKGGRIKLIFWLTLAVLLQLFFLHPLALYGAMASDGESLLVLYLGSLPGKLITLAVEIIIYPILTLLCFRLLCLLYNRRFRSVSLWASRHHEINFAGPKPQLIKKGTAKRLVKKI